jgi:hypothetical protein
MTPEQKLTVDKKEFFEKLSSLMEEYSVECIEVETSSRCYHESIDGISFDFSWRYADSHSEVIRYGGSVLTSSYTTLEDLRNVVKYQQEDIDKFRS